MTQPSPQGSSGPPLTDEQRWLVIAVNYVNHNATPEEAATKMAKRHKQLTVSQVNSYIDLAVQNVNYCSRLTAAIKQVAIAKKRQQ